MATVSIANGTYLASLFNPQVVGDMIDKKLIDLIKFAPLAKIDTNLEGRPGNTITLPYFNYIGDATEVAEGNDITVSKLTESTTTVTISKIGKGVQITDEAVLSGYGDPIGESVKQIAMSMASKVDNDCQTALAGNTTNVHTITAALTADDIADALVKFGEDIEGSKVILIDPTAYATLRKADDWLPASEIAAETIMRGTVGMIHGCQVVVTNRIKGTTESTKTTTNFFIVKPGALAIYLKRDVMVETDRDIINKSTVITADKHFATYLYDPSKAIKIVQEITA